MLRNPLRWLLAGSAPEPKPSGGLPPRGAGADAPAQPPSPVGASSLPAAEGYARHSLGLEQFLSQLRTPEPLRVLDVGGVTQANVEFLTGLGHKVFSEDFRRPPLPSWAGAECGSAEEPGQEAIGAFLRQNLEFPAAWFDAVLLWDALEFLPPPLLKATVERLHQVTSPGGHLLAFFHADEKAAEVASYSYRIQDAATLMLVNKRLRRPCQSFNNRSVEKLFQHFQSVKFFLARDHLREVIVRR